MSKHIGIVACSAEGASLCYRTICQEGAETMGRHAHPEISLHNYSLGVYMNFIEKEDWPDVAKLMVSSAKKLAKIGAEFIICPDNTIHQAMPYVGEESPIPWLHIAEEAAKEAQRRDYRRVGILGTRYLMEGPVYPEKLERQGIAYVIPSPEARLVINTLIFDELVYGIFTEPTRDIFYREIAALKEQGCDAVVLGCTEIPLIVIPEESPLPVLDSTRILARAALQEALGQRN